MEVLNHPMVATKESALVKIMKNVDVSDELKIQSIIHIAKRQGVKFKTFYRFRFEQDSFKGERVKYPYSFELKYELKDLNPYKEGGETDAQSEENRLYEGQLIDYLAELDEEILGAISMVYGLKNIGYSPKGLRRKIKSLSPSFSDKVDEAMKIYSELEDKREKALF